jgi:hypothetical protein
MEESSVLVTCACPSEPTEESAQNSERALAPYFPPGAAFRFFWPTAPPEGMTAAEWFRKLVDSF